MKKYIIIIIALVVVFSSCEIDPLKDVKVLISPDLVTTTVNIIIQDAATDEPIGFNDATEVEIKVLGKDKDQVIDLFGSQNATYDVNGGFISLAIHPSAVMSFQNPIEFTVVVEADGYVSNSAPIYVYEEGHIQQNIKMVNYSNTPKGVESTEDNSVTVVGGAVQSEIIIETGVTHRGTKATLGVPQNMVMKDENGTPLSGTVTTNVTYFSPMDNESLAAYPGGLQASVDTDNDGQEEDIWFTSAGFVAIEMTDDQGRKAKNFENGKLEITVDVPANLINPETGVTIQDGDIIDLWSYEEETGKWSWENTVTIDEVSPGVFKGIAQVEHLSFWNWDWKGGRCPSSFTINFIVGAGDSLSCGGSVAINLEAFDENDVLLRSRVMTVTSDYSITIINFPDDTPMYFKWTIVSTGDTGRTALINDLCGTSVTIDLGDVGDGGFLRTTTRVSGYCPGNSGVVVYPTFPFWYRNVTTGSFWTASYMRNGEVSLCVKENDRYAFLIYSEGRPHVIETEMTSNLVECTGLPFPSELCSTLFE